MRIILFSLILCMAFVACQDEDEGTTTSYAGSASKRIKRITGENSVWGKYRLEFTYESDGSLKEAWRLDAETGDTTGVIKVSYDVNYHLLSITDYVYTLSAENIQRFKEMYPDTWRDTLKSYRTEQLLCSVELKDGGVTKILNRPRRHVNGGGTYIVNYVKISSSTQYLEERDGRPAVIRCMDRKFPEGAENNYITSAERTVGKYEFIYDNEDLTTGIYYVTDAYSETSWREIRKMEFSLYSGIVTGVDSDTYKMRRGGNKVVVAEPGKTLTYELDSEGCAVSLQGSDGETATFEYEPGSGNFYELFAMPLDQVLGKVWVR